MHLKEIMLFPSGQLLSEEGKASLLNKQEPMFYRHSQHDLKIFLRRSNVFPDVLVGLMYPVGLMGFVMALSIKMFWCPPSPNFGRKCPSKNAYSRQSWIRNKSGYIWLIWFKPPPKRRGTFESGFFFEGGPFEPNPNMIHRGIWWFDPKKSA